MLKAGSFDSFTEYLPSKNVLKFFYIHRGFPIKNANDFNDFSLAFGWKELPYIGGAAVRTHVTGCVYTTNECPNSLAINFHHEMAQVFIFYKFAKYHENH